MALERGDLVLFECRKRNELFISKLVCNTCFNVKGVAKMVLNIGAFLVGLGIALSVNAQQLAIEPKGNTENEKAVAAKLKELVKTHDLGRWTFSSRVVVDDKNEIPFSHPTITMPGYGKTVDDEVEMVGTFVHEQFHWAVMKGKLRYKESTELIKKLAPHLRSGFPYGSQDEDATMNHVPVCYMEYKILAKLFGEARARASLEKRHYYKDVYAFILNEKNYQALEDYMTMSEVPLVAKK
jgi:hypothetical protein